MSLLTSSIVQMEKWCIYIVDGASSARTSTIYVRVVEVLKLLLWVGIDLFVNYGNCVLKHHS